jgi:hypothetical protein
MRKLTLVVVAALATAVPSVVVASPGHAKPPRPKAELVTKKVTATVASGRITAGATVKNKGNKKAPASQATFYLSKDTTLDRDDTPLGSARVGAIKAKKSKPAGGTFAVPATTAVGTYHVVVCADAGGAVKERKETNNCKGSQGTVVLDGTTPTTGTLTVSATAGVGGTVAASAVTGGSCAATTCTFPTPGTGTVTFTPTAASGYRFGAWTGTTCTGYTSGTGGKITFSAPTASKACTANFVKLVTITFKPDPIVLGDVTAVPTGGTCTIAPITKVGTCTLDSGASSVVLTATPLLPSPVEHFTGWTAADALLCDGVAATNTMTFTNPTVDKSCTGGFAPGP